MRKWTRWEGWVVLVAGAYAALAAIWTDTTDEATWTMVVLGAVTAAAALWSLAMPDMVWPEWSHVVLGVLLFIAPWVMGFADLTAMAWTAWITGAVAAIAGGLVLLEGSNKLHRMHAAPGS